MNAKQRREQLLLDTKNAYLAAFRAVNGDDLADKSQIWYERGWFYLMMVTRDGLGLSYPEKPEAVRDWQLREMTRTLQRRLSIEEQIVGRQS